MSTNDPYLIISADSHAGLPTEQYRDVPRATVPRRTSTSSSPSAPPPLEAITELGVRNEEFAKKWFEEHDEELARRLGRHQARPGARRRRRRGRGRLPRRRRRREPHLRAVRRGPRPLRRPGPGARHGRARKAHNRWLAELCSRQPGAALRRRPGADHRPRLDDVLAEIRRAKESGLGAVMIPADVGATRRRTTTAATTRCGRCCEELRMPVVTHSGSAPRDEYGDHLGIYVTEVTWWPARPLWFLLWSGRVRALPGPAVRRHRGRLLVAAAACCGSGTGCSSGQKGAEKLGTDPFRGRVDAAERVRRPQLLHRAGQHQAPRARHALRDRHRQHAVGHRLPAPRGHLAQHPRVAGEDLLRHPDRRDAGGCSGWRRPRRSASTSRRCGRSPRRSARRRRTSGSSATAAPPPTSRPAGRRSRRSGRHWLTGHDFSMIAPG